MTCLHSRLRNADRRALWCISRAGTNASIMPLTTRRADQPASKTRNDLGSQIRSGDGRGAVVAG